MIRAVAAALLLTTAATAQEAPPGSFTESRALPGLSAPGEIIIDRAGIPHIYAANARDGFFLQGYAVARDRLWQIDLWRKRGLGRLSASFGAQFVAQDRAARLLLYRGEMAAEWAAYPSQAKVWTEAFAAGINAYVADVEAGRAPLPIEFSATNTRPERWQADDVVRIRSNALASNLTSEVVRARALCGGDLKYEPLRRELAPAHTVSIPKGLDPCSIPADVLDDYALGTGDVRFDGQKIVVASLDPDIQEGSNNWVISAGKSATGRPILANDPHRAHAVPNLRYLSHIDTPELKIAGSGEPALPGISFGHNEDVAWAITIFAIDQQDLVVNPKATKLTEVRERIEVKGEAPREVVLKFTEDGPIIHEDPTSGRSFALRATWTKPGASAYFNASWAWTAKTWDDFLVARDHWGAPPLNLLFANRAGDIGWAPGGFVPVRAAGDGLLPVPAGKAHRWTGLLDAKLMPVKHNPADGWIATANEMNIPAGYPHMLGLEWADRSRITRISEVIGSKPKFGLTDAMALQNDPTSPMARRALALLQGLAGRDANERGALALLGKWNGHEGPDSAAAALYEIWAARHLAASAVKAIVPETARRNFGRTSIGNILPVLEDGKLLGPDSAALRAEILLGSLGLAFAETARLLGPDPATWRWGALHRADFQPSLPIADRDAERRVGPVPIGGSGSTPMAMGTGPDFRVVSGASVRVVMDVGAWDNSMAINTPGQSGDPSSPHYRDLFPRWATGNYVPFVWSRPRVLQEAERIINVTPGR
ncbi:penicillin acylase family protein [Sandarakinorhabdus limnophila]|uniref:penicillin acylase family protein n=1 Tax=Sandarakinorhabdus limnophila TaxID=210512 RepID=UPI0026EB493D|nr:penicillin acylase family protein [Sandarakinorhabdus limnophila]MCM0033743.1 penicillin acylase family protein [Sandarakinorhabdus limnophila]